MNIKSVEKQFARQIECAKEVGIYDAMFLAFGSLLGYVREGTVIAHDHDMDVGFDRDMITGDQELAYLAAIQKQTGDLGKHGLGEYRFDKSIRPDGRLYWCSIKGYPDGVSCCHWFFWRDRGYAWHSKGPRDLFKGMPAAYLGGSTEVSFLGSTVNAPLRAGSMLDWWYPGNWTIPVAGGNSSKRVISRQG